MKYLLDTHTFVWMESNPERISATAARLIRDVENTLLLSLVTLWELQIKIQIGKLKFQNPFPQVVQNQLQNNQMEILSLTLPHILEMDNLAFHHRDPFDRLLIAQARIEGAVLLSNDSQMAKYPVPVIW